MAIPRFIPLEQAAEQTGISAERLCALAESGKIEAARFDGKIFVNATTLPEKEIKEETTEYKAVAHLRGTPIGIGEAARKYGIPHPTISRWRARGVIAVLGRDGQKVFIDEADIAYAAKVYQKKGGGVQGKRIFQSVSA